MHTLVAMVIHHIGMSHDQVCEIHGSYPARNATPLGVTVLSHVSVSTSGGCMLGLPYDKHVAMEIEML